MSAAQVVTLAAAGQLKVPGRRERHRPFEIAETTVKHYAHLARRAVRAKTNGHNDDAGHEVTLAVRDGAEPPAPQDNTGPEHSPLIQRLLAKPETDRRAGDLVGRRQELVRRWVRVSIDRVRAENPTWDQLKVCRASQVADRLQRQRFDDERRRLAGREWWSLPHDLPDETIRELYDLADREEAELEALEARYPRDATEPPQGSGPT
jgi:hypothetical protein